MAVLSGVLSKSGYPPLSTAKLIPSSSARIIAPEGGLAHEPKPLLILRQFNTRGDLGMGREGEMNTKRKDIGVDISREQVRVNYAGL